MLCPRCWGSRADPSSRSSPCRYCTGKGIVEDRDLSPHFMLSELLKSPDALRHGIANDPTPAQLQSIALLTQLLLEPIRVARGPIVVSSGLRDPMVNAIVGGQPNSAHLYGHAADIEPQNCSIREVIDWLIHSDLLFDEVIFEGHWVHVARMGSGGTQRRKAITLLPGPDGRRIASPYDPHDPRLST